MKSAGLFAAVLVSGCTVSTGHEKVDGWPQLEVVENHVPKKELSDRCGPYAPFGTWPIACAQFFFAEKKCVIWFNADSPPSPHVIEHERRHCQGYDHIGSSAMREALERWNGYLASAGALPRPAGAAAARMR